MRDNPGRSAGRVGLDRKKDLTVAEVRLVDLLREGLGDGIAFMIVVRKQADGRFFVSQSAARQASRADKVGRDLGQGSLDLDRRLGHGHRAGRKRSVA